MKRIRDFELEKLLIIIFTIMLILSISTFWIGLHNLDVCHNEQIISLNYDLDLKEMKTNGDIWSLKECYVNGLNNSIIGVIFSIVFSILVGYFLGKIKKWKSWMNKQKKISEE